MHSRWNIELNSTLKILLCLYAFSLPFELLFEIVFGVETIFKPFRIIALAIIGVFGIKTLRQGLIIRPGERNDLLFYGLIIYGILISCFRIITGPFNTALFSNDLFLVGLNVIIYFIFKNTHLTAKEQYRVLIFFIVGVIINSLYIFYTFYFQGVIARQSGFSDNPNYVALAIGIGITFLLLRSNFVREFWHQIGLFSLIAFLIYIFLITGSRTGLIVLVLAIGIVFIFSTLYRKLLALFFGLMIIVFLLPRNLETAQLGGPMILLKRINKKLDQDEVDVRFVIWKGVFRMLEEEGYVGMGIGQYKEKFGRYFSTESHLYIVNIVERDYFLSTHNDYLAILTDYGLPGLLFYIFFLIFAFIKLLRNVVYPEESDEDHQISKFLNQFKFILICSLMIFGIASENLPNPVFWFLMMMATKNIDK